MARPSKEIPKELIAKYQTGVYSISKLAKEYNITKSVLSEHFKRHNIKVSEHAKQALTSLDSGFKDLSSLVSEQVSEQPPIEVVEPCLVVDEVIRIVKSRNPQFAEAIQTITAKAINRINKILDSEQCTLKDIKNVTSSMKDVNDYLQIIPKPPAIAQQININNNKDKKANNNSNNNNNIQIEFIE